MSDLELKIYGIALVSAVIASFIATVLSDDDTPEGRA